MKDILINAVKTIALSFLFFGVAAASKESHRCPAPNFDITFFEQDIEMFVGCSISLQGIVLADQELKFVGGSMLKGFYLSLENMQFPIFVNNATEFQVSGNEEVRITGLIQKLENSPQDFLIFAELEEIALLETSSQTSDEQFGDPEYTHKLLPDWLQNFFRDEPLDPLFVPTQVVDPVGRSISRAGLAIGALTFIVASLSLYIAIRETRQLRLMAFTPQISIIKTDTNPLQFRQNEDKRALFVATFQIVRRGIAIPYLDRKVRVKLNDRACHVNKIHFSNRPLEETQRGFNWGCDDQNNTILEVNGSTFVSIEADIEYRYFRPAGNRLEVSVFDAIVKKQISQRFFFKAEESQK